MPLVKNEVMKMLVSRKPYLILVLLVVFIGLFAYGEQYSYERSIERLENISEAISFNWENLARQQIKDMERRMTSQYISEEGKVSLALEIEQLKYFIENDINPITPSAAKFAGRFAEQGILLLLPLLVIILAADIVSGEFSTRSIKVLLTRAVPRWKILLSKLIALFIMITLVILLSSVIAIFISVFFFGRFGFDEPVITGFSMFSGGLNVSNVIEVSQLEYLLLLYSLAWFVCLVIGGITFMISVLVRSTSASIGIIMTALIGGQFLQFLLSDWELVKYFFVTNMNLPNYLSGDFQVVEGMSFGFSVSVLSVWALLSVFISFVVFQKKDVLV